MLEFMHMAKFYYKAKRGPQEIVEGSIEAESRDLALVKVTQLGLFPVDLREERQASKKTAAKSLSFNLFKRIPTSDLSLFTRQLSDLLNSGITLLRSLEIIQNQTKNPLLRQIVLEVHDLVRDGATLSDSLSKHPDVFSKLYASMVKSGELSGSLDAILSRLADFSDAEEETRSKVRASLAYPTLMAVVGTGTIFVLITFVVPRLVEMFIELSQVLPLPTRILINTSNFFARFWWLMIIVATFLFTVLKRKAKNKEVKFALDRFKLKVVFLGDFIKKVEIARFARTLGTLLANGVIISRAMEVTSEIAGNEVLHREIDRMLKDIINGSSLTNTLVKGDFFPEVVRNMVAVGEETGALEKSLFKIADSYERQADQTVKIITSLLEPIMIVVIGSMVGFIVIAMLLPIFQMNLMIR